MANPLSEQEQQVLLKLARKFLISAAKHESINLDISLYSKALREKGASFVTLTKEGVLRGCIGVLEAYRPLVQDVCENAISAATKDYRFSPVKPHEIQDIHIEISRLTTPLPLLYQSPQELIDRIRPGVDGVVIRHEFQRATFLPQVWDKIPETNDFLSQLCLKMGVDAELWMRESLSVSLYQVEEFEELK
ncbi:MAG: AmmeMemoRadiSam system protein A [Anaerolineaceae bacterium]|nr:AmmeMemoRadiSam system protein A [Anaerolineaceae bacterium]